MKWISTFCLIVSLSMQSLAANATDDVKNFYTQFDRPASSLTLFVESLLLTDYLTQLKSESKISQWLMSQTISVPDREVALKEFLQDWTAALKERAVQNYARFDVDTISFYEIYFSKENLASDPKKKYVKTLLQEGFGDKILGFLNQLYDLERQNLTSKQKVLQMLNGADVVVNYDEDFLNVAAQIGVIFSYSADPGISASAMYLLTDVARKQRVAGAFDPTSPEMLLGGSGIFRRIISYSLMRATVFRSALSWITEISPKYVAVTGAASFHAAALLAATADPKNNDKENEKVKQKILAENQPVLQSVPHPQPTNSEPVVFNDNMLYAKAYALLKSYEYAPTSIQYGDLFAEGEIAFDLELYYKGYGASNVMDKMVLKDHVKAYDVRQALDAKTQEFESYMQSRKLQTLDSKAILKLRLLVADLVSNYQKGETYSLPLILGGNQPGNCVARALVHTAFFYPLFLKYKPANLEYGMISTLDHIEAVLFNTQTKKILSIQAMDQLHDPYQYYGPGRLTIYSPKILIAAYLFKKFALIPYEFKDLVLHSSELTSKAAKNFADAKRIACYDGSPCKNAGIYVRDAVTAPFLESAIYRNPFGDGLVGDPTYMESFLPLTQDPSPGLTANVGSASRTESVIDKKTPKSAGTIAEVSPTLQYAALKHIQNFTTSYLFGTEDKSPDAKPKPCVGISKVLMACSTSIPQYLSFPVFNARGVFNILLDPKTGGELPFTNRDEFTDFLKETSVTFFESDAYIDLQTRLQNINASQYPSIDSLISSLNLYALYMDIKNASMDAPDLEQLRQELIRHQGLSRMDFEAAKFKKSFSQLLEDKSGVALKTYFEDQVHMDDTEIIKRGIAFQIWYSLLTPAEKAELLQLTQRIVWNVQILNQKTKELANALAPNTGKTAAGAPIYWLSMQTTPAAVAAARAQVQSRLQRTQDSQKINITINSFTGLFILSTFANDWDEKANDNLISKFSINDFLDPATKMGQSLATLNSRWSSVNKWLGTWEFLYENCEGKKTPSCKIANTIRNAILQ